MSGRYLNDDGDDRVSLQLIRHFLLATTDERIGNFVGFPRCSGLAAGLELLLHQLFDPV
jgi:hypothetical protein